MSRGPGLSLELGRAASQALLDEVALPGKPGLVGPQGPGAHADMDYDLMVASGRALRPWFSRFAELALELRDAEAPQVLAALRPLGQAAEADMFRTTCGVNTHKGAVFSLGLLVAAAARLLSREGSHRDGASDLCAEVAAMASGLVEAELAGGNDLASGKPSAGLVQYKALGARGARGQAEAGFPILQARVLPALRSGGGSQTSRLEALLGSMAELEDTCVLSRGGPAGLAVVRTGAGQVLDAGGPGSPEGRALLEDLDRRLCAARLSPGGSADLLAAGLFVRSLGW